MGMQAFNEDLIRSHRAVDELPGGMRCDRVLELTTTGHLSGAPRTAPMLSTPFDGDPLVIASNDGATQHPI